MNGQLMRILHDHNRPGKQIMSSLEMAKKVPAIIAKLPPTTSVDVVQLLEEIKCQRPKPAVKGELFKDCHSVGVSRTDSNVCDSTTECVNTLLSKFGVQLRTKEATLHKSNILNGETIYFLLLSASITATQLYSNQLER